MHELHEAVEVHAQLRVEPGSTVEQIDETGLAAPDPTPYVQAARGLAPPAPQPPGEPGEHPPVRRRDERAVDSIELVDQRRLRRVGHQDAADELVAVPLARGHRRRRQGTGGSHRFEYAGRYGQGATTGMPVNLRPRMARG